MTQIRNPFQHHHDHGHDEHDHDHEHGHDHDHEHDHEQEELDPAQQSLADALRVSFAVLKLVMLGLVVLYICSGYYTVPTNKAAVELCFGRIIGEPGHQAIEGGGFHYHLPFPFEQVLFVPLSSQQLKIDQTFWWAPGPNGDYSNVPPLRPLNPEYDGVLITGDKNLVHTRWSVTYHMEPASAVDYIRNVNDQAVLENLIKDAAEESVVFMISHYTADDVIQGRILKDQTDEGVRHMQELLDGLGAGVHVDALLITDKFMPGPVRMAYEAVVNAETEKAQKLEQATEEYNRIMGETAGAAHTGLWDIIRQYEHAVSMHDEPSVTRLDALMDTVFRDQRLDKDHGGWAISGKVAELINDAENYRSSITAQVESEASSFSAYQQKFAGNPALREITMARLWLDAKEKILSSPSVETIYLPDHAMPYFELSRDPAVTKARQEQLFKQQPTQGQNQPQPMP